MSPEKPNQTLQTRQFDHCTVDSQSLADLEVGRSDLVRVGMNETNGSVAMATVTAGQSLLMLGFGPCLGALLYSESRQEMHGCHFTPWMRNMAPHPVDSFVVHRLPAVGRINALMNYAAPSRARTFIDGIEPGGRSNLVLMTLGGIKGRDFPLPEETLKRFEASHRQKVESALRYLRQRLEIPEERVIRKDALAVEDFQAYSGCGMIGDPSSGIVKMLVSERDSGADYETREVIDLNL